MKYAIQYEERKGKTGIFNRKLYNSFEEACAGLKAYIRSNFYNNEIEPPDCDDFGGQISKGTFYSEEQNFEVIKLNE